MLELVNKDKDYDKHKTDPEYLATKQVPTPHEPDTQRILLNTKATFFVEFILVINRFDDPCCFLPMLASHQHA